jgi:putative transcriptional regulator
MSKRNLFDELSSALSEAREHDQGKIKLKTHKFETPKKLSISPDEIVSIRERFNMSRGVFANYFHTSNTTLENWEQGHSVPNNQAVTLFRLIEQHPEILNYIAEL